MPAGRRRLLVAIQVARARHAQLRGHVLLEERERALRYVARADPPRQLLELRPRQPALVAGGELALRDAEAVQRDEQVEAQAPVVEQRQHLRLEELARGLDELRRAR